MMAEASLENLYIPLAEDGREICLRCLSKVGCIMSYTRSHEPVQGQNRGAVICFTRIGRDVMDSSRKRKFNGGRDRGSHWGHWERSGVNGTRNLEGQNHRNGTGLGCRRGGHSSRRQDRNNSGGGGGGARGGNGNNTNPSPPTRTD